MSPSAQPNNDANADAPVYAIHECVPKKVPNLGHAVALHYMHNNFCRIHQTLRVTPAMETDVSDHVWSLDDVTALLEPSRN
jgi:hypothetical protein